MNVVPGISMGPEVSTGLAGSAGYPIARRTLLTALSAGLALGLERLLVAAQPEGGAQRSIGEALSALRHYTGVYRLGGDHRAGAMKSS